MEILKVSAKSRSTAVAGAIAGVIRESGHAEVQAIGAGAVNQAVKAVAIARGYLAEDGIDIICIPSFTEVNIGDQERTAIKLTVERRPEPPAGYKSPSSEGERPPPGENERPVGTERPAEGRK